MLPFYSNPKRVLHRKPQKPAKTSLNYFNEGSKQPTKSDKKSAKVLLRAYFTKSMQNKLLIRSHTPVIPKSKLLL